MPNKEKTPTSANVEASITNPLTKGDLYMSNNNTLTLTRLDNTQPTMSSISFLDDIINPARVSAGESQVENRHFITRIEDEIDDLGVAEKFYVTTSQGAKRQVKGYKLNIEQMTLIGMRESKAVRRSVLEKLKAINKTIIDPMMALNDPEFLRGSLLVYTEKVIELESKVEEMRDDVETLDRIAKSDGCLNLTSTAKHLQYPPRKFNELLESKDWIYKRRGQKNWLGYQDKVKQGLLTHKVYPYQLPDGTDMISEQVLVTPKGLTKLSQMISLGGVV